VLYECTKERGSDSEHFGKRITEFGATVVKICEKNFRDLFLISEKWLGLIWNYFFSNSRGLHENWWTMG
jgi:hypothetical protein